jgi:hypothetical protein
LPKKFDNIEVNKKAKDTVQEKRKWDGSILKNASTGG